MHRTVVLDVVGLTRRLLGAHTPRLAAFAKEVATIGPVLPAVTCTVQSTYTTGLPPSGHGIVANGWYFRDLSEIWLWRQSNRLVQGDKVWDVARKRDPSFTSSNTFWWYAMATRADVSLTPRPLYCADGLKLPDCYTYPLELRDDLTKQLGTFPLFHFWGPNTSIVSSEWIANATIAVEERFRPTLQLVYLPHLDYCLQREGPEADLSRDLGEIDAVAGRLIDHFRERGLRVVVLSEYGIVPVRRPVHPNRLLREAGLLRVKVDLGREYLDPGTSRAFAVSDHQIAHVYVGDPADVAAVKELFTGVPGIGQILDDAGKRAHGLDHERSGEIVLLAEPDSWFTYYFWLDDARAPDYARMVEIHRKPGFDPCELYVDPALALPYVRAGLTLARKTLGFRYTMELTPLDATLVKGSHGLATADPETPVFASSEPRFVDSSSIRAVDVRDRILDHLFRD
ncbi:MAG: alkaline phosphatase family protein [Deltaproteobacteria bacterium]|nr:alkaline phosphatase family protein [Deltaproteobacteria bacterium]